MDELLKIIYMLLNCYKNKQIVAKTGVVNKLICAINKNSKRILRKIFSKVQEKVKDNKVIVEIDKSKFAKRKYNRDHAVEDVWASGIVERTEKQNNLYFIV
ncbi:hypothetical protein GVAV_001647 [Gurleya vavrai]